MSDPSTVAMASPRGAGHSVSMFIDTIFAERLALKEGCHWRSLLSDFIASSIALENLIKSIPPKFEASALSPGWAPMDMQIAGALPTIITLQPEPNLVKQHQALFGAYAFNDNASKQQLILQGYIGEGGKVAETADAIDPLIDSHPMSALIKSASEKPPITLTKEGYLQKRADFQLLNSFIDSDVMTVIQESAANPEVDIEPCDIRKPYFLGKAPQLVSDGSEKLVHTKHWKDYSFTEMSFPERIAENEKLIGDIRKIFGNTSRAQLANSFKYSSQTEE
eukprot:GHVH01004005.1.p2 GENE.GHVH01004005.1~~GHVH01004005.1.p2  ORF type:complete len:279 (-),score=42.36 GHVH01004005.1:67-903(-)